MPGAPIHILVAESEEAHVEAIRRAFAAGGKDARIQSTDTLAGFRTLAAAGAPDIAIMNLRLADGSAMETLSFPPETCAFPVLILTDGRDETMHTEVLAKGAIDSVVKSPESFAELPRTVERALHLWRLLLKRRRTEEHLWGSLNETAALMRSAGAVLTYQDFTPTAKIIFTECKALLGATAGYVALLNRDGSENEVLFLDSGGRPCTVPHDLPMPIRGLRAEAYRTGRAVYDNDFAASSWMQYMPGGHVRLDNVLFAPLPVKGRVVGLIGLANKPGGFTENDVRMAAAFGEIAAVALMNARNLEALEENERRYRTLVETATDAIISINTAGEITLWNGGAEKLFGYSAEEALGREISFIMPERFREAHNRAMQAAAGRAPMHGGPPREVFVLRKDGAEVPVELTLTRWETRDGVFFTSIVRDITERKLAEAAVKEERDTAQLYLDTAGVMMVALDREGRITLVNRRGCDILGYREEELLGRNWFEVCLPTERVEEVQGVFLSLMRGEIEPVEHYENPVLTRAGEERQVAFHNTVFRAPDGAITGILFSGEDITEQRQAEMERERAQEQLVQAQKMEVVGRLAGGVAHDFNNMLGVILGYTEILKTTGACSSEPEALTAIEKAATRAKDITRQLLAFSRKEVIAPRPLNLNVVLTDSQKMLTRLVGEDIEVRLSLAADLGLVRMDPSQVDQILLNLAANARDAMPDGGSMTFVTANAELGAAFCRARPEITPGPFVMLTAEDSGCGMAREIVEHVFEPFYTTKGIGKGTGLGLATIYGIVKQNNGHIEVESTPGRGTTFTLYFPRVPEPEPAAREGVPTPAAPAGSETILLVEDEEMLRDMTTRMLERQGYRVVAAATAEEGLAAFRQEASAFDLLMTDVILPGMSGKALSERLLALKPGLRVLFFSGFTAEVVARKGILPEGEHFLAKPFTRDALAQKLREVLAAGNSRRAC